MPPPHQASDKAFLEAPGLLWHPVLTENRSSLGHTEDRTEIPLGLQSSPLLAGSEAAIWRAAQTTGIATVLLEDF